MASCTWRQSRAVTNRARLSSHQLWTVNCCKQNAMVWTC